VSRLFIGAWASPRSRRLFRRGARLLQSWQDFFCDQRDLVDRFRVRHVPHVAHHEEVAQAADVVDEFRELLVTSSGVPTNMIPP
jgi:hypothetical protein